MLLGMKVSQNLLEGARIVENTATTDGSVAVNNAILHMRLIAQGDSRFFI